MIFYNNNTGTDKEEENKLARPLAKKKLPAEGMINGKKVRGRRRYRMIENITINGQYDVRKRKAEKRIRVEDTEFAEMTCPWAEHYDLLRVMGVIQ